MRLVIWTDMPNPNQQTDDELLERAKRLAAQISDPKGCHYCFRLVDRRSNTLRQRTG
jgi:hypothetical protein